MTLSADDLALARRFVEAHGAPHVLAVGVTGSHYYGFPSRDSDLDLKGVHVTPTAAMVSLGPPADALDFLGDFAGREIDYTSHELGAALRMLIKGNGNMLERLLTPLQVVDTGAGAELRQLAQRAVSRRFHYHYRGFFRAVRAETAKAGSPSVKALLYAYRTALTGIHLLRTGECVGDLLVTAGEHGFAHVRVLVDTKRAGAERGTVDGWPYEADWTRLDDLLQQAHASSTLPDEAPNTAALSAFLVAQRRHHFD